MTDINQKYKKLTDVEHVLIRPGRYIGSIVPKTAQIYVVSDDGKKMVQKELTWNPGFLKLFDEIISNSVDHSKRPEGAGLDTIRVNIDKTSGVITVHDNGGIPIIVHSDYNEYLPTMLLGYLRSGSNFDDTEESDLTGQNGEGASLTNIFSTKFTVESCDGKKKFKQVWTNNMMAATKPEVTDDPGSKGFTKITYLPDYAHLGMTLDDGNYAKLVKRVYDIAGCNPKLKIYLNGDRVKIASFKDYIEMYTDKFEYDDNGDWQIGVAPSDDGFEHISFVNSTETAQGGTHIPYVMYQVAIALRQYIVKKHKIDVKPNEIQSHMRLFINARIIRPRYDSQTKENLITEQREFKTAWECSDKFLKRCIGAGIVDRVLLWAEARAKAEEMRALRDVNKSVEKVDPRRVEKFSDANEDKDRHLCEVYLTEGDSARNAIARARGKNPYIGSFALKGKPINVMDVDLKKLLIGDAQKNKESGKEGGNQEIKSILKITGLKIGEKVTDVKQLRFGKIVILSDEDLDGYHVSSLLINIFAYFWPELFDLGVIYRMKTPLVIARTKNDKFEFFTDEDYEAWAINAPKHTQKRFKGLGAFRPEDFEELIVDRSKYLTRIKKLEEKDLDHINLAFKGNRADDRKVWLEDVNYFNFED